MFDDGIYRALLLYPVSLGSVKVHQVANFWFNLLKPSGYVMHQQFNVQKLYVFTCFVFI